ncbi:bifunctional DedA family/phosphatase PAP2 family protein [Pararhodobacter sp. CCB-MM2]|uniref:bifunctional DedA family/phosphatase PAP2 family protein n=1 Tax=Pararhodobacter sp. CCB-MM2 TaxID=1786003 RepID=UPI0008371CBB|nr:bifunctional DedA family/phosphatase PAP2 family protein [Pararhodobacter sp. CCB-MM2]
MFPAADQILPALAELGSLTYAVIALAAMLEGWFVTGVFVPGSLIVDAGGILAQQGVVKLMPLMALVALGSIAGSELGYWTGRLAKRGLQGRLEQSRAYQRATRLFEERGGLALVIGRFLGPVSGLVPMAAAMAGMEHRRFLPWSIAAAIPYAVFHVALGYVLGDALTRLGPLAGRVALVVGVVLVLVVGLVWLVRRILRLGPFVKSVGQAVLRAVLQMPVTRVWIDRHPRSSAFIAARFQTDVFTGLPVTVLAGVFVYVFGIWVGSVFDWLTAAPIVAVDTRVANLLHAFWSPGLLRGATWITALGDTRLVAAVTLAFVIALAARGRMALALAMVVAVVGNAVSVTVLKLIFQRERPPFAFFTESTNSFPSGHAAISVAFWGTIFYVLWRAGLIRVTVALVLAPLFALLIGGSRLVLGQHYLSDVFNGWLVGALWVVVAVVVAEWWRETHPRTEPRQGAVAWAAGGVTLALGLYAASIVVFYDKAQNIPWAGPPQVTLSSPLEIVGAGDFEPQAESVIGTPLEPVNLILAARDAQAVTEAMAQAGWQPAGRPGWSDMARAVFSAWRSLEDPTAPLIPYFWAGAPHDMAFEKPASADAPQTHHHVRFWQSRYVTAEGATLFVGAASLDRGLGDLGPDPDAERAALAGDLQSVGAVLLGVAPAGGPEQGLSISGEAWQSDGNAAVLALPLSFPQAAD